MVSLIGGYVLPIVEDIWTALCDDPAEREMLRRFVSENPSFVDLTRQRAISYWNEYYRRAFPVATDYPGIAAVAALQAI